MKNFVKLICSGVLVFTVNIAYGLDSPQGCAEITKFLQENRDKYNSFEAISALPAEYQRIAFSLLTTEQRVDFLNAFLNMLSRRGDFSPKQLSFIELLKGRISPDILTNGDKVELAALEQMARELFGKEAPEIFDPTTYTSVESVGEESETPASPNSDYECNCSGDASFSTCSGDDGRGHSMRCVTNIDREGMCTGSDWGCGFLWRLACNGECYCSYQDEFGVPYEVPCRPGRNVPVL